MKKSHVLFCCLAAAAAPAHGAAGAQSLDFLRLNAGPRETAMGGAAAAVGGDAYSFAYNPALLASLRSQQLAFAQAVWVQSVQYQDLAYGRPTAAGAFGARLQRLDYGNIPQYDAAGAANGSVEPSDFLAGLGYARDFPSCGLALGGGFKFVRESLGPVAGQTELFDLGAAWRPERGDLSLGLALLDLGPGVSYDTSQGPSPTELVAGVADRFYGESLVVALDGHFPRGQAPHGGFGAELWVLDALAFRAGLELLQDEGAGIRAGLGFRFQRFQVDYAFSVMGDLGQTHHAAVTLRFGGPAETSYRAGLELMRAEKYPEAVLKFNEALQRDPNYPEAGLRLKQAYEFLQKPDAAGAK
jgi:hypothetical protein